MNIIGFKVPFVNGKSLFIEEWNDRDFYKSVHFHEEYQLTYIVKGEGTLVVGSNTHAFKAGDAYFFGKNLPHVFRNEQESFLEDGNEGASYISVFFNAESLLPIIESAAETKPILELIEKADFGLKLDSLQSSNLHEVMYQIKDLSGFDRVAKLLFALEDIANNGYVKCLADEECQGVNYDAYGVKKLNDIFSYIEENHIHKISLEDIAAKFSMNPSSFCRFFKSRTQKTFSQYLIELRVAKACELMRSGSHNATETCFDSGFTNLSNFHRQFKSIIGMTPTQYRDSVSTFYKVNGRAG